AHPTPPNPASDPSPRLPGVPRCVTFRCAGPHDTHALRPLGRLVASDRPAASELARPRDLRCVGRGPVGNHRGGPPDERRSTPMTADTEPFTPEQQLPSEPAPHTGAV